MNRSVEGRAVTQLKPAREREPRKLLTFTRLGLIQPTPLDPVVDGWIYADCLGSTIGKSGSCKSFFMQGVASSVALGVPYMGRRVKQGAVFYLGGEGLGGIRKRFAGWSSYTGLDLTDAPIYIASGLPSLANEINAIAVRDEIVEVAEQLFYAAGAIEPVLVLIDTVARAMLGADENATSDMGNLVGTLDLIRTQFRCAVEVIHHTGHGDSTRGRGNSALYAALDAERLVTSDGGMVTVTSTKEKDWPKPDPLYLERRIVEVEVGDEVETTLVLDKSTGHLAAEEAARQQRELIRLRESGQSIREVANALGVTRFTVESALKRHKQARQYEDASNGF